MYVAAAGAARRRRLLPLLIRSAFFASESPAKRVSRRKPSVLPPPPTQPAAEPPRAWPELHQPPSAIPFQPKVASVPPPPLSQPAAESPRASPELHRPPSAIPFQPKVANVVRIVGRVGLPVNLQKLPDGRVAAVSVLVQDRIKDLPQFWIPVIFQDELAKIAAGHLKEDDLIYVHGQLSGYAPPFKYNEVKANIQLLAHELFYVNKESQRIKIKNYTDDLKDSQCGEVPKNLVADIENEWDTRLTKTSSELSEYEDKDIEFNTGSRTSNLGVSSVSEKNQNQKFNKDRLKLWEDLVANPQDWIDNRNEKLNGLKSANFPDFKHKLSKEPLWLSSAPDSVRADLENTGSVTSAMGYGKNGNQELWNDVIKNPKDWWDNRGNKLNPKNPDFKHKTKNQSLWLDHSTPEWILENLPPEKSAVTSQKRPVTSERRAAVSVASNGKTELWQDLIENPSNWWDNRTNKKNPKAPDFKHRAKDEALWISSRTPEWIISKLPPLSS